MNKFVGHGFGCAAAVVEVVVSELGGLFFFNFAVVFYVCEGEVGWLTLSGAGVALAVFVGGEDEFEFDVESDWGVCWPGHGGWVEV